MKRILFSLVALLFASRALNAQDTVIVQTLTLDSNVRAGVWQFPDDTTTWRKVLMRYRMRCHDAQIGNGSGNGCREWDYHCNTVITDSSRLDSALRNSNSHSIANFSGTSFPISNSPTYTYYQYDQQQASYASPVTDTNYNVGGTATPYGQPFSADRIARTQYLWTAAELSAAGMTAGMIYGIEWNLTGLGSAADFLRIRLRNTSQASLSPNAPQLLSSADEVYFLNTNFASIGTQQFRFHTPFYWNGTDNVVMELSFDNSSTGISTLVDNATMSAGWSLRSVVEDGYIRFTGSEAIDIDPAPLSGISNEITVAFWAYGDAVLPQNTTIFEATNAAGARHANVHLPWSDGRAYWDCGADAGGYDRIDIAVNPADYKGRWTHWAFTKNAATGQMRIYKDGQLFHSGTGKTKPIDIENFRIGQALTGSGMVYYGNVNDFQVWSKALDAATIQAWMHQDLNATHPEWASLEAWYKLDETSGNAVADASPNAASGTISGWPLWRKHRGNTLHRNFVDGGYRPITSFYRGPYTIVSTPMPVLDSLMDGQHRTIAYAVNGSDLVVVDTNYYYQAGWSYVYNEAGQAIDSILVPTDSTIGITILTHYAKTPMRYEILSFITPYGNGLDLGQAGVMWEFDMTDYTTLLRGRKHMSIEGAGNFQEELDIQFVFISGTPPREVQDVVQLWPIWNVWGGAGFNQILNNSVFEPRQVTLDSASAGWKIRSVVTGHDQNGEFIPRWHWFNINGGVEEFRWQAWKECSTIPIYPQGGTWPFDRAGWCPGDPSDLEEYELGSLASPGQTITIDYGMDVVSNTSASYYCPSNQLVSYGPINFSLDAAVERVKRPTNETRYARFNPACNQPVVIIRNEGSTPLSSLTITYNRRGGSTRTYNWTGLLGFMETAEVTLPVDNPLFWVGTDDVFEVRVSAPNGGTDEQPDNDYYFAPYTAWDVFAQGQVELQWRTNNNLSQTSWKLYDETGTLVLQNLPFLSANTTYSEMFNLPAGCYTLKFTDTADDGLYYWYYPNNGQGFARIRYNGAIHRIFEPEFGRFFQYDFYTDGSVSNDAPLSAQRLVAYPNPSQGDFMVWMEGVEAGELAMEVFDVAGRRVWAETALAGADGVVHMPVDLQAQPAGAYWLRVVAGGRTYTRELVKQ